MPTGRPAGRPAKPTEVKRLEGNPGKRPLPEQKIGSTIPGLNGSIPKPPTDMGKDGKRLWKQVWTSGEKWLSPDADYPIIMELCHVYDDAEVIRKMIAKGEVERWYITGQGQIVQHPAVSQLKNARVLMNSYYAALGFSPADRARLGLAEVKDSDPLDELLKRRLKRRADNGTASDS